MTDLEQNANPTLDNAENINSDVVQTNELNINSWEISQPEQANPNFLENTPNDVVDNNLNASGEIGSSSEVLLNNTPEENQLSENLDSAPVSEAPNNEVILWKFENTMINNTEEQNESQQVDNSLLEHSMTLDTPAIEETNANEQQKNKLAQKEKLLQLIKVHESKAQKSWFVKWILSGVVLTIWIVALSCILAKDQIVNLLGNNENPSLTASVVDLTANNNEEIANEENVIENENLENIEDINSEEDLNEVSDEENSEENYRDFGDYENEESLNEDVDNTESDEIMNENSEYVEETLPENNEEIVDEENVVEDENLENVISEEEYENLDNEEVANEESVSEEMTEDNNWYNITYVDSEEAANWVLPSHCSDLTCYGENKEFTPCSSFKKIDNLDENAHRIGNNWVCRYKDASELVYVELK